MPSPLTALEPARCPLCGQVNRCAMEVERATGLKQPACWCTTVDFSSELLDRLPAQARGKACICPTCAAAGDQPAALPSSLALRKPPVP